MEHRQIRQRKEAKRQLASYVFFLKPKCLAQLSYFSKIAFKRVRSNAVVASHSKGLPK